jgi:hypothetical protein
VVLPDTVCVVVLVTADSVGVSVTITVMITVEGVADPMTLVVVLVSVTTPVAEAARTPWVAS